MQSPSQVTAATFLSSLGQKKVTGASAPFFYGSTYHQTHLSRRRVAMVRRVCWDDAVPPSGLASRMALQLFFADFSVELTV